MLQWIACRGKRWTPTAMPRRKLSLRVKEVNWKGYKCDTLMRIKPFLTTGKRSLIYQMICASSAIQIMQIAVSGPTEHCTIFHFPFVRPSVRQRQNISAFLDKFRPWNPYLNAYHLGWSSWPTWPPRQPSTTQCSPVHSITAQHSPHRSRKCKKRKK